MSVWRMLFGVLLGRRLPRVDGRIGVAGVADQVVIRRDGWGVPHIEAASEADAVFGLGFCHAQDRAFQLEGLVRVIRGTLAELVGPEGLAVDRLSRRIGFRRAAQRQLEVLAPDVHALLNAYVAGINAGISHGLARVPHELALLRSRPTTWDAADGVGLSNLMAFLLSANWDSELARLQMLMADGAGALGTLDPVYPEWGPVTAPPGVAAGPAADRLAEDLARFLSVTGASGGSNNWAVAASRTATGRPLLANDPHLAPSVPSQYYLAHLRCPDWEAAGASLVGSFGIFAGHNDAAAWGVTAGLVDNTDLCVEEIGADGRSVRRGDRYVACGVIPEVIRVKGADPVVEEVLLTPEGPIVGPALEGDVGAVSLRATWLEPRPLRGALELVKLRTPADFHTRLGEWPASSQNVVFATVDGHIGWQLVGEPPRRRAGAGAFPVSGRDPEAGWDDIVSFAEMPRALDPDCGWIATANTKPRAGDEAPFISADFPDGYRLARIGERLAGREDWDIDGMAEVQLDLVSIPWRQMREVVLAVSPTSPGASAVQRLLAAWDGRVAADSPAATVFELLVAELATRIVTAKAPHSAQWALGRGFTPLAPDGLMALRRVGQLVRLLREQPSGWFSQSWAEVVAAALETVAQQLRDRYGDDEAAWAWGRVRPLRLVHQVGRRPPLDRVFNLGPLPGSGDANTIAQAAVRLTDPTANTFLIPMLRMVIDVGRWDRCRWALPGGQSGNPCSPHYDDQLPRWQAADGIPIPWTAAEIDQATRYTLSLQPA